MKVTQRKGGDKGTEEGGKWIKRRKTTENHKEDRREEDSEEGELKYSSQRRSGGRRGRKRRCDVREQEEPGEFLLWPIREQLMKLFPV